ncbi:ATP-binding protein [Nannocystaceae bacterium ST9]
MDRDPQPGLDDFYHRARARAFFGLVALRRLFLPMIAVLVVWVAIDDSTSWRRAVLFGAAGVLCTVASVDVIVHRRVRRESIEALSQTKVGPLLGLQVAIIAVVQSLVFLGTGGMASPLLPVVLPVVFMTALFLTTRAAWLTVAVMASGLWLMAIAQLRGADLAPAVFAFDDGHVNQPPALALAMVCVLTFAMAMAAKMGGLTRAAVDDMVRQALQARDMALASRAERTRELTTLSAEIAHELKNPLASIKGLAALIDRELGRRGESGKSLERITVLRREVDRMQTILDEFLNFSRPLIPLSQRTIELRDVIDHVVVLHEALASERRVELVVRGEVEARCDPRKLEQIVINVVQNALHVAPPGSRIELALARVGEQAQLIVRDEGPGVSAELHRRVFEPGVTTKHDGSGLGLTVARSLARQHGGELELSARADGRSGCEAKLELPLAGLAESEPVEAEAREEVG